TLAATSLYRMMAQRIGREYSHSQAKTVFRNLLDLSGKVEVTATSGGAGIEEIDPASQELAVLQEPKWGADGRPVHELDSHLRTQPCQSVRLPHRVTAARRGVAANAVGLDALELPRDAGADRRSLGCGIGCAESCMAEKDSLRPGWSDTLKWPPNGHLRKQNHAGFWPGTEVGENVSCRPLRPSLYERSTDHPAADPRHAGIRRPAGLDYRPAGERGR